RLRDWTGLRLPRAASVSGEALDHPGGGEITREVAYANRVDPTVVPLDAADDVVREFNRGDLLRQHRITPLLDQERCHHPLEDERVLLCKTSASARVLKMAMFPPSVNGPMPTTPPRATN